MPLILTEDEGKKLGKRQLTLPPDLVNHLSKQAGIYSGNEYKQSRGYKRLSGLLNKDYNDVKGNKAKNHNGHVITFPEAKRMDFDIRHMKQSADNPEYEMIGGDMMRDWLRNAIGSLRSSVKEVGAVPEVPKLNTKDVKPKNISNEVNISGADIRLEDKEFNNQIKKLF